MLFLPTLLQAAGTGLGLLGQLGSANRFDQVGEMNQQIATSNAQLQKDATLTNIKLDRIGQGIEFSAAKTNLRLALADSEARQRNADRLRLFAEAKTKQSRVAIMRQMKTFEEFQSGQSAAVANSGVVMGGSAMEVLLASAEQFRTQIADMHDEANFERNNTIDSAAIEEIGANRDAIGARANFGYAKRGMKLGRASSRIGRINAQTAFQSAVRQATVDRLSSQDAAQGQRMGAVGNLLSSTGNLVTNFYNQNQLGMGSKIPSASVRPSGPNISIFK